MKNKTKLSVFITLICFVSVLYTTKVWSATIQLPQTGQSICYGWGEPSYPVEVPCLGSGQDGDIRVGVPWPDPRFLVTYCDPTGPCPDSGVDCDGDSTNDVITDALTGLIWARDGGLGGCYGSCAWGEAIDFANSLTLCGYSDWRLPNVNELGSIASRALHDFESWGFTNIHGARTIDSYWSSTTIEDSHQYALNVTLGHVYVLTQSDSTWILPVRGVSTPPAQVWKTGQTLSYREGDDGALQMGAAWHDPRFNDHGHGAITDNLTGLMWTKDANGPGPSLCNPGIPKNWFEALDHIKCLNENNYLGYTDWRLPNSIELVSLIDYSRFSPALPSGHPFMNVQGDPEHGFYWTSTPGNINTWIFAVGVMTGQVFDSDFFRPLGIWPVRGGIPGSSYTLLVTKQGSGYGTVVSIPERIECGTDCTDIFNPGIITLTAMADPGSDFAYWSGGCTGTLPTCQLALTEDLTVNATFLPTITRQYPLRVLKKLRHGGSGTVVSEDRSINCGDTCRESYYKDTPITLIATPAPGSAFAGWVPSKLCSGTRVCTITMDKAKKIKANFIGGM